jgi:8-oxo-dGTP diphosphatase
MTSTIVVSAVVLLRDGAVLTVRKRGTSRFMLVGGKPEPGEDAEQCAVREAAEEVGLALTGLELLGEFVSETANEPGHVLRSTVFTAELTGEPVAAGEIEELRWTRLDGAVEGAYDDLAPMLEHHVIPALAAGGASPAF